MQAHAPNEGASELSSSVVRGSELVLLTEEYFQKVAGKFAFSRVFAVGGIPKGKLAQARGTFATYDAGKERPVVLVVEDVLCRGTKGALVTDYALYAKLQKPAKFRASYSRFLLSKIKRISLESHLFSIELKVDGSSVGQLGQLSKPERQLLAPYLSKVCCGEMAVGAAVLEFFLREKLSARQAARIEQVRLPDEQISAVITGKECGTGARIAAVATSHRVVWLRDAIARQAGSVTYLQFEGIRTITFRGFQEFAGTVKHTTVELTVGESVFAVENVTPADAEQFVAIVNRELHEHSR